MKIQGQPVSDFEKPLMTWIEDQIQNQDSPAEVNRLLGKAFETAHSVEFASQHWEFT